MLGVPGKLYMLFDGGTYTSSTSFCARVATPSLIDARLLPTPVVLSIVGAMGAMVICSRSTEP